MESLFLVKRQTWGARGGGKLNSVTNKGNVLANEYARETTSLIFINHNMNDFEQAASDYSSSKFINKV